MIKFIFVGEERELKKETFLLLIIMLTWGFIAGSSYERFRNVTNLEAKEAREKDWYQEQINSFLPMKNKVFISYSEPTFVDEEGIKIIKPNPKLKRKQQ